MPNNYVLLERIELNDTATSVTFNNIPQTGYTDLKIVMSARDTSTAGANWNGYSFTILPNGLSTNITQRSLFGNGSSVASYSDTSMFNVIDMGSDTANTFSNVEIYIPNYTSNTFKSFSIDGVAEANATNTGMRLSAGLWSSTAAITSIKLNPYSVFAVGSTFTLYGIAKSGTTPAIAPKADGGNVIATDGTYWYHAFLSNGTFTPQVGLSADVLVVAGGGGGGGNGGGGGAGGLLGFTAQSLASGTGYSCTVGAGSTGGSFGSSGSRGSNSQFASLTASVGGGAGMSSSSVWNNGNGGSGGGRQGNGAVSSGTSGQGSAGGNGFDTAQYGCGGGGGAVTAGGNGTSSTGGAGGTGSSSYSSWGLATATGQNISGTVYFAGGGGGCVNSGTGGAGGSGGGATGTGTLSGGAAPNATVNTGGGGAGGGGSSTSPQYIGGNGGSGIIIIRYPVAS